MKYRSLVKATEPTVEPVTLTEAKAHCRIESSTDDGYVGALITAAREWVEDYLDRALITQQLTMRLDGFPGEIELPRPPMSSTQTAVTVSYVLESGGSTETLPSNLYRVDRASTPGVIRNLYSGSWPTHLSDANSVTVTWWAGYGDAGTAVPTRVRHAMLMLMAMWYERRLAVDDAGGSELPYGVTALLDSVSWGNYR